MVFRRRNMGLRPVNTLKHVVDSQNTVPAGTQTTTDLVVSAENPVSATANANKAGSHVRSIFLNVQVVNSAAGSGSIENCYMYVILNPGGNITPSISFPTVNEVGQSNMRKQVFHQDMAMLSNVGDSIPITLFKGVLKIPRKGSRLGVDDKIQIVVGTPVGGPEVNVCIQCIYKEIR